MTFFNRISLIILSVAFLSHCTLPKPQGVMPSELSGQGNFFIDQAQGQFVASTTFEKIDLPKARNISFRVCLKDRRSRAPIMNQVFEIAEGPKNIASSITDNAGCLTWSEELTFSIFKRSHNILFNREVRNRGRFTGHTFIKFVVNPWNSQIVSEIETYLRAEGLDPISLSNLMASPDTAELRVLPLRSLFTIQEVTQNKGVYKLDFMGQLMLENRDHLNQVFQVQINRARLRSRITILNRRKDGEYYLIYKTDWSKPEELKEALINIETVYESNTSSCKNGRLDVALELDISDSVVGLRPFEMIYQGPNCQANGFVLMVPHSGFQEAIRRGEATSLNHYLSEEVKGIATMNLEGGGEVSYLRPLEFQFSQVTGAGFERSKTVRAHTCLSSVVDFDLFKREPLKITTTSGTVARVTTDDEGCFSWNETFKIDYFAGQCWKQNFVNVESESGKIRFQLPIGHISNGRADVYRDLRYFSIPANQMCHMRSDLKSEIYLSRVTFEKLNYTYEVDDFLNIILVKRGILQINPFLRRESLLDPTGIDSDELPPGQYRLAFVIMDIDQTDFNKVDGAKVFSVTERIVTVRANSLISERIEIRQSDIRSMGNTNRLYVTLEPAEASEITRRNLRTRVFSGPIIPQNNNEVASVEILQDDKAIAKIIAASRQHSQRQRTQMARQLSKESFAQKNRLTIFNLDQNNFQLTLRTRVTNPLISQERAAPRSPLALKTLTDLFANPARIATLGVDLCNYWLGDYGIRTLKNKNHSLLTRVPIQNVRRLLMTCREMVREQFSSVFDVQLQTFVNHPRVVKIDSAQFRDIGVAQNFSQNRSISDTVAKTLSWDIGAGLKMPDIPGLRLLSANTGVRFAVNRSWSDAESQNMFEAISSGVTFNSETVRLRIESPKLERCLAIRLNKSLFMPVRVLLLGERPSKWFSALHHRLSIEEKEHYALSGIMICEGEANAGKGEFVETYSIFNQKMPVGASLLDPFSNNTRPFFISIRGHNDYLKFLNFISAQLKIPPGFEGDYARSGFREDDLKNMFRLGFDPHPGVTQAIPSRTQ